MSMDSQCELPKKVDAYLAVLNRMYENSGEENLQEIVVNGLLTIEEEYEYDNWNGGTYGHAITLTISEQLFAKVLDSLEDIQVRIREDINKVNSVKNESICEVFIEFALSTQDNWRHETGMLNSFSMEHQVSDSALERIWGESPVRLFLSHKSSAKVEVNNLKQALSAYGISAFVAHEDIEPTQEWHREIERALFSMDAIVALLTENFNDGAWTNQEIGVAIGRGVPVIGVRLGSDPCGLMGKGQGLGGCDFTEPKIIADKIYKVLHRKFGKKLRLFDCAINQYSKSSSFDGSAWVVEKMLSNFENLDSTQVQQLLEVHHSNVDNRHSFKGRIQLRELLEQWTGESWTIKKNNLERRGSHSTSDFVF